MKIKAIALDDEALAMKIIAHYAPQMPDLLLEKTFTKVSEAKKFLAEYPVDLIFLDIEMPAKAAWNLAENCGNPPHDCYPDLPRTSQHNCVFSHLNFRFLRIFLLNQFIMLAVCREYSGLISPALCVIKLSLS